MLAIVFERNGGPEVLEAKDVPDPQPAEDQVLVDVEAAGVNFRDVYERMGTGYGSEPPAIIGVEGAGRIAGSGEPVAWVAAPGSYAQRVAAPRDALVPVPEGVSSEAAAAVLLQGMTAHYLAADSYPVQEGDWVLVHAAAGGVGLLLTQLVKLRGGRVIATTSTPEKADLARRAGADEVIGYDDFAVHVRELTSGEGVAAVYDGVGKTTFSTGLEALAPDRADDPLRRGERPARSPTRTEARPGRIALRPEAHAGHLHPHPRATARPRRGGARACGRGQARRAHRGSLPARGGAARARGSRGAADDGEAAAHPVAAVRGRGGAVGGCET